MDVTGRRVRRREPLDSRVVRANPNVVSKANREIELDLGMRRVNLVLDQAIPCGLILCSARNTLVR